MSLSVLTCLVIGGVRADEVVTIAGSGRNAPYRAGGKATQVAVAQPFGISVGPDEAVYICEVGQHVIRRLDRATGTLTTVAGSGMKGYSGDGGVATDARLNEPYEVRFDASGHLVFVEMQNHVVRRVDRDTGIISTIAGTGDRGFGGDGGPATEASLNRPHSIAFDPSGNLYICDIGNHRIRRVDAETGLISTWGGTGERQPTPDGSPITGTPLNGPRALDYDSSGNLFLALREGNSIWRIDLETQRIHHIAGTGESGYTGDGGPAKEARLSGPKGIAIGPTGDVFFADTESHTIRVIRSGTGIVETVIGDGVRGNGPEGDARTCRLDRPHGVYVSGDSVLLVGDSNNHQVRELVVRADSQSD